MVCEKRPGEDIHEIERRSHAPWRWAHRCNYLFVCRDCHSGELDSMPHAKQLAYKQLSDPDHYDLEEWLMVKDLILRAPDRVTQAEVNFAMKEIIKERENANG